jgi:hypothetical protein
MFLSWFMRKYSFRYIYSEFNIHAYKYIYTNIGDDRYFEAFNEEEEEKPIPKPAPIRSKSPSSINSKFDSIDIKGSFDAKCSFDLKNTSSKRVHLLSNRNSSSFFQGF